MNRLALLLDRLQHEPSRLGKLRLMTDYFRNVADPDRGFALAALTGALSFRHAKPGLVKALIATRVDPVLFDLSYDFVGDLSETVALLWPTRASATSSKSSPSLSDVVRALGETGKIDLPRVLAELLDGLDETGRWALLKLITGAMRIGASARLAKQAVAELGGKSANDIEDIWHALKPPYLDLFAWLEGREARPATNDPAAFCPAMLAHAITESELADLAPAEFRAEWKWDGIRVQAAVGENDTRRQDRPAVFPHRGRYLSRLSGARRRCSRSFPIERSRSMESS